MKILFIGQRGIPTLMRKAARESRVEVLACGLAEAGHKVLVSCSKPFVSPNLRRFNGVGLKHIFSLNPSRPGGWLHSLLALKLLWQQSPDAVHMHGWRMATLSPIAVLLSPETTFVWTADSMPVKVRFWHKLTARWTEIVCDAVTTPTRQLQYTLLNELNVRAQYVPDGFAAEDLPDIPARGFKVRKGQFCLTTATEIDELRWVARAYKQAKTRKKLVVMVEAGPAYARLKRNYTFLHFVGVQRRRATASLINQAAAVIVAGSNVPSETVLKTMASGVKFVATTNPMFEELIGATGPFVKTSDVKALTATLNKIVPPGMGYKRLTKAKRRAQASFDWARIAREYAELYHGPATVLVPLDSAKPSFADARSAQ